ncbi:hypothetical protein EYF80_030129 [Liparis tanakae]|uniref:Uncharacterized protein n=1 Tax=Liparis tanakae TaxID=230148 RepID=A0A4Z2H3H2_9TELE|nr:hypothetical protein EYF80_030129 [Liparis tanakae]
MKKKKKEKKKEEHERRAAASSRVKKGMPEWSCTIKTWYLKPFHVLYTSLAGPPFGPVRNELIRGGSAFELHQTAVNPTLRNRTQSVLASVEGFQ